MFCIKQRVRTSLAPESQALQTGHHERSMQIGQTQVSPECQHCMNEGWCIYCTHLSPFLVDCAIQVKCILSRDIFFSRSKECNRTCLRKKNLWLKLTLLDNMTHRRPPPVEEDWIYHQIYHGF